MTMLADRLAIIDLTNRFGIYTDWREWEQLRGLFKDEIMLDCESLTGEPASSVKADGLIFEQWKAALSNLDATQHFLGNHAIDFEGEGSAVCRVHVRAMHVLPNRTGGDRWMPSGTYRFELEKVGADWKISGLTLKMLWSEGNQNVLAIASQQGE